MNATPSPSPAKRERLPAIDILRGFVMAVMALDHTRDYFTIDRCNWMDPSETRPSLLLTRWFAQMCAPAFFMLAGMGVYLSFSGGKSAVVLSKYLLKRGLVLILHDITVVRIAWDFNFRYDGGLWFIVLTTIGVAMIVLAGLIHLPIRWIVVFSAVIIAGHNLFDAWNDKELGAFEPLWTMLHVRGGSTFLGIPFYVTYPLIPWIGVMSLGFALGPIWTLEGPVRRRRFFLIGFGCVMLFIVLRATNFYGDPRPWHPDPDNPVSLLAFLRTKKYPASFQHVLMTVGVLLMVLSALDRIRMPGAVSRWFISFGRAPLFFYVIHLYVIHGLAVLAGWMQGYNPGEFLELYLYLPKGFGFSLPMLYVIWLLVLAICYPVCIWFDRVKRRSQAAWMTYL